MITINSAYRYYYYTEPTDMRMNFDALSGLVKNGFNHNPLGGDVFIFINKRCNHIKLLQWQDEGFAVYHKRLEKGTYELPLQTNQPTLYKTSSQKVLLIFEGISLKSVKKRTRYTHAVNN